MLGMNRQGIAKEAMGDEFLGLIPTHSLFARHPGVRVDVRRPLPINAGPHFSPGQRGAQGVTHAIFVFCSEGDRVGTSALSLFRLEGHAKRL